MNRREAAPSGEWVQHCSNASCYAGMDMCLDRGISTSKRIKNGLDGVIGFSISFPWLEAGSAYGCEIVD